MDTALVADIRAFNRFYTRLIGVLEAGMHETPFTLAEARVIYEIGKRVSVTHGELARALDIDPGYLTRLNFKLTDAGVVGNTRGANDRRSVSYALTREGDAVFAALDAGSDASITELLAPLNAADRVRLATAMRTIRAMFGDEMPASPVVLRPHRLGELGWLIHRQAVLYNQQHGWNGEFETLIAKIYHDYEEAADAPPKALWVAERNGAVAGSVFCTPAASRPGTAQLRMLYVEPEARGLGIGTTLVAQCVDFARGAGYGKMRLWTQSVLSSARKIYAAAGFELTESAPHHSFGKDLVGEYWELTF